MGQPTAIVATPLVVPIAVLLTTPITAFATPLGPPPARYLCPSTARDRLNHTFNGLAISLKSVQPTATATTLPKTQIYTPTTP